MKYKDASGILVLIIISIFIQMSSQRHEQRNGSRGAMRIPSGSSRVVRNFISPNDLRHLLGNQVSQNNLPEPPTSRRVVSERAPTSRRIGSERTPTSRNVVAERTPTSRRVVSERAPTSRRIGSERTPTSRNVIAERTPTSRRIVSERTHTPSQNSVPIFRSASPRQRNLIRNTERKPSNLHETLNRGSTNLHSSNAENRQSGAGITKLSIDTGNRQNLLNLRQTFLYLSMTGRLPRGLSINIDNGRLKLITIDSSQQARNPFRKPQVLQILRQIERALVSVVPSQTPQLVVSRKQIQTRENGIAATAGSENNNSIRRGQQRNRISSGNAQPGQPLNIQNTLNANIKRRTDVIGQNRFVPRTVTQMPNHLPNGMHMRSNVRNIVSQDNNDILRSKSISSSRQNRVNVIPLPKNSFKSNQDMSIKRPIITTTSPINEAQIANKIETIKSRIGLQDVNLRHLTGNELDPKISILEDQIAKEKALLTELIVHKNTDVNPTDPDIQAQKSTTAKLLADIAVLKRILKPMDASFSQHNADQTFATLQNVNVDNSLSGSVPVVPNTASDNNINSMVHDITEIMHNAISQQNADQNLATLQNSNSVSSSVSVIPAIDSNNNINNVVREITEIIQTGSPKSTNTETLQHILNSNPKNVPIIDPNVLQNARMLNNMDTGIHTNNINISHSGAFLPNMMNSNHDINSIFTSSANPEASGILNNNMNSVIKNTQTVIPTLDKQAFLLDQMKRMQRPQPFFPNINHGGPFGYRMPSEFLQEMMFGDTTDPPEPVTPQRPIATTIVPTTIPFKKIVNNTQTAIPQINNNFITLEHTRRMNQPQPFYPNINRMGPFGHLMTSEFLQEMMFGDTTDPPEPVTPQTTTVATTIPTTIPVTTTTPLATTTLVTATSLPANVQYHKNVNTASALKSILSSLQKSGIKGGFKLYFRLPGSNSTIPIEVVPRQNSSAVTEIPPSLVTVLQSNGHNISKEKKAIVTEKKVNNMDISQVIQNKSSVGERHPVISSGDPSQFKATVLEKKVKKKNNTRIIQSPPSVVQNYHIDHLAGSLSGHTSITNQMKSVDNKRLSIVSQNDRPVSGNFPSNQQYDLAQTKPAQEKQFSKNNENRVIKQTSEKPQHSVSHSVFANTNNVLKPKHQTVYQEIVQQQNVLKPKHQTVNQQIVQQQNVLKPKHQTVNQQIVQQQNVLKPKHQTVNQQIVQQQNVLKPKHQTVNQQIVQQQNVLKPKHQTLNQQIVQQQQMFSIKTLNPKINPGNVQVKHVYTSPPMFERVYTTTPVFEITLNSAHGLIGIKPQVQLAKKANGNIAQRNTKEAYKSPKRVLSTNNGNKQASIITDRLQRIESMMSKLLAPTTTMTPTTTTPFIEPDELEPEELPFQFVTTTLPSTTLNRQEVPPNQYINWQHYQPQTHDQPSPHHHPPPHQQPSPHYHPPPHHQPPPYHQSQTHHQSPAHHQPQTRHQPASRHQPPINHQPPTHHQSPPYHHPPPHSHPTPYHHMNLLSDNNLSNLLFQHKPPVERNHNQGPIASTNTPPSNAQINHGNSHQCHPSLPNFSCEGKAIFSKINSIGAWCIGKCVQGQCVESVCKCGCYVNTKNTNRVHEIGTEIASVFTGKDKHSTNANKALSDLHASLNKEAATLGYAISPIDTITTTAAAPSDVTSLLTSIEKLIESKLTRTTKTNNTQGNEGAHHESFDPRKPVVSRSDSTNKIDHRHRNNMVHETHSTNPWNSPQFTNHNSPGDRWQNNDMRAHDRHGNHRTQRRREQSNTGFDRRGTESVQNSRHGDRWNSDTQWNPHFQSRSHGNEQHMQHRDLRQSGSWGGNEHSRNGPASSWNSSPQQRNNQWGPTTQRSWSFQGRGHWRDNPSQNGRQNKNSGGDGEEAEA